jgi:hypothetical protein
VRLFFRKASELIRLGDTRALELVIGLMAICLGYQFLTTALDPPDNLTLVTHPLILGTIGIMAVIGGGFKVVGAVLDYVPFRTKAALLVATTWVYLVVVYALRISWPSTLIFIILASQSIWIYTRLSIIKNKEEHPA